MYLPSVLQGWSLYGDDETECLYTWRRALEDRGMRISRPKTQFIDFKFGQGNGQGREQVKILGEELQRVHRFKYLGASVEETEGMTTEISQRVSAAWGNWKRCSGVLYDRRMPVKLKGKVYKTVVRHALLYSAETWATTRRQEARLEVNEMRMQRWMCGVTRRDKIRNKHIRGTDNKSGASVQENYRKTTEVVLTCEKNERGAHSEKNVICGHTGEKKKRTAKHTMERYMQERHDRGWS